MDPSYSGAAGVYTDDSLSTVARAVNCCNVLCVDCGWHRMRQGEKELAVGT